jgi:hypothetical protein
MSGGCELLRAHRGCCRDARKLVLLTLMCLGAEAKRSEPPPAVAVRARSVPTQRSSLGPTTPAKRMSAARLAFSSPPDAF